jgi:uncharacterized protein (UPF0548 family)
VLGAATPEAARCALWRVMPATSPADGAPGATRDVHDAPVLRHAAEDPDAAFDRVRRRLFAYDVFPPRVVGFRICSGGTVAPGALIIQRVGAAALRVEFAVRVVEVWDRRDGGSRDAGFRYVTLRGHPERGAASFRVRRDASGGVRLTLEARSEAGTWLTRVARPAARLLQLALTGAALRRLAER